MFHTQLREMFHTQLREIVLTVSNKLNDLRVSRESEVKLIEVFFLIDVAYGVAVVFI